MNPRERALAIFLISVIILGGGGFFGYQFVYVPYSTRTRDIARLKKDAETKRARLDEIDKGRSNLARWRVLSLPGEADVSRREYEKYLNLLLSRHNITNQRTITPSPIDLKSSPTTGNKEPIYIRLTFLVQAYASLSNLAALMAEFYDTGLLHEIKHLDIKRQATQLPGTRADEMEVHMTIEALIVNGADRRPYLLPNIDRRLLAIDLAANMQHGPTGLGLATWAVGPAGRLGTGLLAEPPRYYEAIAKKNIFLGRTPKAEVRPNEQSPEWMAPRYVHLTDITTDPRGRTQGWLYDVSINRQIRLRATLGFDQFTFIKDGNKKNVVRGTVLKIEDRDVIYRAEVAAPDEPPRDDILGDGFFRLSKKERDNLVADRVVRGDDAANVFRIERSYWDVLVKQKVIRESGRDAFKIQLERDGSAPQEPAAAPVEAADDPLGGADDGGAGAGFPAGRIPGFGGFGGGRGAAPAVEVLSGSIVQSDAAELLVLIEPRYYGVHVGQSMEDSLKKPFKRDQIKELKLVAN